MKRKEEEKERKKLMEEHHRKEKEFREKVDKINKMQHYRLVEKQKELDERDVKRKFSHHIAFHISVIIYQ